MNKTAAGSAQRQQADWWLRLAEPKVWLLFLVVYLGLHMAMRLLLSDTLQVDDAEQIIHSQSWQWDYGNFQPPFYTWVLWGLWHFVEPSIEALYLIRYLLIGLSFWLWHRISLHIFDDPRWQVTAATSWLLLMQFGWKLHQGSTHTTLLTLALLMSLHAIVLIVRSPNTRHYLYLGFSIGLGMSAKYSFAGFLVPMVLAALWAPDVRPYLLRWQMMLTIVVSALFMAPSVLPVVLVEAPVNGRLQSETTTAFGGLLMGDASFALGLMRGSLEFLTPLWLAFLLVFYWPRQRKPQSASLPAFNLKNPPIAGLLSRFHQVVLIALIVAALFLNVDHLKARWLHPFVIFVPFLWLIYLASIERGGTGAFNAIKWTVIILMMVVIAARLWQLAASPFWGKASRVAVPVMQAVYLVPDRILQTGRFAVPNSYLAAHIRLRTGGYVSADRSKAEFEIWGGEQKELPAWVKRNSQISQEEPSWVMARQGGAEYWIGWLAKGSREAVNIGR